MSIGTDPIQSESENNVLQTFSDATAGRSLQLYYGCATTDTGGIDHVLVRDVGISNPTSFACATDSSSEADFDITINKPTIFSGLATVDFTFGITGGAGWSTLTAAFTVYHYDGVTETSIGSVSCQLVSETATSQTNKAQLAVSTKLFGIGHVLRLNVVLTESGAGSRTGYIKVDPQTADSELKLWIPVRVME